MKKISILILCLFLMLMTGCTSKSNKTIEKIYLNNEFYNNGEFIDINNNDINDYNNQSYILYTYNNYCSFSISCDKIFEEFMSKYKIDFLTMSFEEFKKTHFYNDVEYAPSIIIIEKGKIIAYLDANKDEDLEKYQDTSKFEEWLNNYVYFSK